MARNSSLASPKPSVLKRVLWVMCGVWTASLAIFAFIGVIIAKSAVQEASASAMASCAIIAGYVITRSVTELV